LYKNEANSWFFAEFLSKIWEILANFMSSMNTFTASMAPPLVFGISDCAIQMPIQFIGYMEILG